VPAEQVPEIRNCTVPVADAAKAISAADIVQHAD
jgi:hypothetical protein